MKIIELDQTESTNSYLASVARESPHGLVVTARNQTSGRGQRGNSWESVPGENVTMSMLLRPRGLHPSCQFLISQAVSLAIVAVLKKYLPGNDVSVKWPNDIYVGDSKICGILIENSITVSSILHSVVGIGLNVNQDRFVSSAPNPVSMYMLTGKKYRLRDIVTEITEEIMRETAFLVTESVVEAELIDNLCERYFRSLWRREGYWPYMDNINKERIMARIASVDADGTLSLALQSPSQDVAEEIRSFAFKEIAAVL